VEGLLMNAAGAGAETEPAVVWWLRLEGCAEAAAGIGAYALLGESWWLFAALALAPDLAMLGYLAGPRVGARVYNCAHVLVGPGVLAAVAWYATSPFAGACAAAWLAHIGADRAFGYGLKQSTGFEHTHLGRVGRAREQGTP
jgi:hypothetical protein